MAKKDIVCSIGDKEFLSQSETLVWMGIGLEKLYQWREDGLKYIRKDGRVFYSKEHIRDFLRRYII